MAHRHEQFTRHTGTYAKFDWTATYLAVLNVILIRYRTIYQHFNSLTAIGTNHRPGFQRIHWQAKPFARLLARSWHQLEYSGSSRANSIPGQSLLSTLPIPLQCLRLTVYKSLCHRAAGFFDNAVASRCCNSATVNPRILPDTEPANRGL